MIFPANQDALAAEACEQDTQHYGRTPFSVLSV